MIAAKDVGKRFGDSDDGVTAIDNISIDIAEGEFVSLLGPSGCGKSTFLRCLAGLEQTTSGVLSINDKRVDGPPERLGMAFQRDALLDWMNVLDNVLLPADFDGSRKCDFEPRARELLKMAGLTAFVHAYPSTLSGGMRQRVAMCRSLLLEPRLLLMDEPFGALDALTRDQLNVDLYRLWQRQRMTVGLCHAQHFGGDLPVQPHRGVQPQARQGDRGHPVELPDERKLSVRETEPFGRYARHVRGLFENMGLLHD